MVVVLVMVVMSSGKMRFVESTDKLTVAADMALNDAKRSEMQFGGNKHEKASSNGENSRA
jgi:hypothetical protein